MKWESVETGGKWEAAEVPGRWEAVEEGEAPPVAKKPAAPKKPAEAIPQAEYESYVTPTITGDPDIDRKLAGVTPLPVPGGLGMIGEPREKVYPYEYIPEAAETTLGAIKGITTFPLTGLAMAKHLALAKVAGLSTEEALEEAIKAGGFLAKGAPPEGPIAETVAKAFELPRRAAEAVAGIEEPVGRRRRRTYYAPPIDEDKFGISSETREWMENIGRAALGTLVELGIFTAAGKTAHSTWGKLKKATRRGTKPEITPIEIEEALEKADTKGEAAAEVAVDEGLKLIRREIEPKVPGKPTGPTALEELTGRRVRREEPTPLPPVERPPAEPAPLPAPEVAPPPPPPAPVGRTAEADRLAALARLKEKQEKEVAKEPEVVPPAEPIVPAMPKAEWEAKYSLGDFEHLQEHMPLFDLRTRKGQLQGARFVQSVAHDPAWKATTGEVVSMMEEGIFTYEGAIKAGKVKRPVLALPTKPTITPETLRENPGLYREVLDNREAHIETTIKAAENIEAYIKTQVIISDDVRGEWVTGKKTVAEISRKYELTEGEIVDILETEGVLGTPKEMTLAKVTDRARRGVKKIADMKLSPEESGRLLDEYFDKLENTLADKYRTSFPTDGEKAAVLDYVSDFRDLIDERRGERAPTGVLGERPEDMPGVTIRGPEDVTLVSGIEQKIYEAVAERFSKGIRKRRRAKEPTTKEAVERIEKERDYLTYRDLQELRERAYEKGFNTQDITELAKEMFEKKSLAELTLEEAGALHLRILEADSVPRLEGLKAVRAAKNVSAKTKRKLEKFVRLRDVDELEFKNYMDLRTMEGAITEEAITNVIKDIRLVNSVRPSDGKLVFAYLAPVKRILGEKFVGPYRAAELAYLENHMPYVGRVNDMFSGLNLKAREAITAYREGKVARDRLSPEMRKASDDLSALYDELWETLNMKDYFKKGDEAKVKEYSPRRRAEREDMINWAFSKRGMKEFDFWAEHERTGDLWPTELDSKANALAYVRGGFRTRYFREATRAAGYDINEKGKLIPARSPVIDLSSQRRAFANRWVDTAIRRIPTKDEQIMDAAGRAVIKSYNRFAKKIFKRGGISVKGNERLYRSFVSTMLDLNYSAFMGLRPKLGLRNLTQQWLIVNEYGLGAYTRGRARLHSPEVKAAMEKSTVVRLREQQYAVFEEHLNRFTDVPARTRHVLMKLYRLSDRNNVRVAFSTGFSKARARGLGEEAGIRAGNEAVHNTQWGYGMDLPYFFRTPTGRVAGQYNSWFIWYADHITRMVKEQHGAKAARMLIQGTVLYYAAERYGIDYTRTFLFGVVPDAFGYGAQTAVDIVKFFKAVGTMSADKIWGAGKKVAKAGLGFVPASLFSKDILEAERRGSLKPLLTYERKREGRRRRAARGG